MKLSFRKAFCLFLFVFYLMKHGKCSCKSMSSPESSGSLACGWLPGETLGNSNIIGCLITACIVLPQKSFGTKSPVSPSLLATNPWPKNPEDSGCKIVGHTAYHVNLVPKVLKLLASGWLQETQRC